jgi:hypothetical protein
MNPLNSIMSTEEASRLWGFHQDHVERLNVANLVRHISFPKINPSLA